MPSDRTEPLSDSRRTYRCNVCGREDVWGDGWSWYGTRFGEQWTDPELVVCSDDCKKASRIG